MCPPDITLIQSAGFHGGSLDGGTSSIWSQAVGQNASEGTQEHPFVDATTDIWGNDVLQLNSSVSFKNFSLAVTGTKVWNMNAMGLGRNSTMLNALHSAGTITSRSWSLFWGLTGADANSQMDGSLVLGGYDAAKVTGDNFTDHLYIDKGCITSFLVTVTDIVMNLPDSSKISILGTSSGAAMRMCIQPEIPLITLPADVWSAFANHSGGTFISRSLGINGYGMLYAAQDM